MRITKLTTIEKLKEIFVEIFLDNTDKVTKVSDGSVLSGVAYGCAKAAQRTLKDVALIESQIFPDFAFGTYLDEVARMRGIDSRFGALGSSMYIRIVGDPGTQYVAGTHSFTGSSGVVFDLEQDFQIPAIGYGYAKVRSQTVGESTNVVALSINQVNPTPIGHSYVINEYKAVGGRDEEGDDVFRQRIKDGPNILATGTLSMIEQALMKINPNVLRVVHNGFDSNGKVLLSIVTQNGIDLSQSELDDILLKSERFLSLTEIKRSSQNTFGVNFQNIVWYPFDVSVRIDLYQNFDSDDVRREMQISIAKYLDHKLWESGDKLEWDDILGIVKNTEGVKYVYDNYFFITVYDGVNPIITFQRDLPIPLQQIPRLQGFQLLDRNGALIINGDNTLNPIYYPGFPDQKLLQTVLRDL